MNWPVFLALTIFSYLLGSVPFGFLMAKAKGVDLQKVGSGNIGATNVGRTLGKRWGGLCFLLDCLKGMIPMLLAKAVIDTENLAASIMFMWLVVGCAAILGHVFSIFLKFTGGKGAATSLGVVLGLYPYCTLPGLATFVVWAAILFLSGYVSLASITAAMAFPALLTIAILIAPEWHFAILWPLVGIALIMGILVVARHAENIKRLLDGSETRISRR